MMNKLKEIRLKNNFTQEYVAAELGVTQKAYSKIETDKTRLTHDKIQKMAKLYKVSPDYFCGISCDCSYSKDTAMLKIKDFLNEKGIEFPDFI